MTGSRPPHAGCDELGAIECARGTECQNTGDFVIECAAHARRQRLVRGVRQPPQSGWGAPRLLCAGTECDRGLPPGAPCGSTSSCITGTCIAGYCACEARVGDPCFTRFECGRVLQVLEQ